MSDAQARAREAERLLGDPMLTEAFAVVVNEAIADWVRTPLEAADKREDLYRLVVAVDRVRGRLRSVIDEGKMAERAAQAAARVHAR